MTEIILTVLVCVLLVGAVWLTEVADDIGADEADPTPDEHATDPGEEQPYTLASGWRDTHTTTIDDEHA